MEASEIIKLYPYRFGIDKIVNKAEMQAKLKEYNLVRDESVNGGYDFPGCEYNMSMYYNTDETICLYAYHQRSTTFFNQTTIGFQNRIESLKFKELKKSLEVKEY